MNQNVYGKIKKEREEQKENENSNFSPIKRRTESPIQTLFAFVEGFYRWDKTKPGVQMELKFLSRSGKEFRTQWLAEKNKKFTETRIKIGETEYEVTEGLDRILATKYTELEDEMIEAYVEYTNTQRNIRHVLVFMIQRMVMDKLTSRVKKSTEIEKVELVESEGGKEILEWRLLIGETRLKVKTEFLFTQQVMEMNFLLNDKEQKGIIDALEKTLPEGVKYRRLNSNLKNEFNEVEFGKEMLLVSLIEQFEQTEFYRLRAIFDQNISQRYKWMKRAAMMNY